MSGTQATTEERVSRLEQAMQAMQAEIDGYREMFTAAARSPFTKQILAQLGIKVDPARRNPADRL